MQEYPYSDQHQLNLDWIIEIVQKAEAVADFVDNLNSEATDRGLAAHQGKVLRQMVEDIHVPQIVDNLNSDSADKGLAAHQGKVLREMVESIHVPDVVDSITSEATDKALSANMGHYLYNLIDYLQGDWRDSINLFAPEYNTETTYYPGDYVIRGDVPTLYKCIDQTSGAWQSNKWRQIILTDDLKDIISEARSFISALIETVGTYQHTQAPDGVSILTSLIGALSNMAPEHDTDFGYVRGEYCIYKALLYQANKNTTGTFNPDDWDAVDLTTLIDQATKVYSVNGQTGTVVLDAGDVGAATVESMAKANADIDVLFRLALGTKWDVVLDITSAYKKTIPTGTHLSVLNGWGGNAIIWNQLAKSLDATNWIGVNSRVQVTFDNGVAEVRNIEQWEGIRTNYRIPTNTGHKWYVGFDAKQLTEGDSFSIALEPFTPSTVGTVDSTDFKHISVVTTSAGGENWFAVVNRTNTAPYAIKNVVCVDLTELGLADSINTPEQFRALFPADSYTYSEGETMLGDVTSIVLKDSDQTTVQTLTVPAAVRALTGYGQTGSAISYNSGAKTWAFTYNGTTTDITTMMTGFDNYMPGKPGGTLTFVNSNGAEYGIPVPSQIDNYRNLAEVR